MQAGKLRHRIAIEDFTTAQDAYGVPIRTWSTNSTVWGSIEPISGREQMEADQIAGEVTHRVRLRHTTNVTNTTRLKFGTRYFDVVSIMDNREIGAELEILCKEKV